VKVGAKRTRSEQGDLDVMDPGTQKKFKLGNPEIMDATLVVRDLPKSQIPVSEDTLVGMVKTQESFISIAAPMPQEMRVSQDQTEGGTTLRVAKKMLTQQEIHAKIEELDQQIQRLVTKHNLKVDADIDFAEIDDDLVSFETKVQFVCDFWERKHAEMMKMQTTN
jgi:hypothetical protein